MTAVWPALFGLAFGSFANACIARIPRRESLLGRSHCDGCNRPLSMRELVPIVSFVFLRGHCAVCAAPIGVRTPVVEAGCAIAFVAAFTQLPLAGALAATTLLIASVVAVGAGIEKS